MNRQSIGDALRRARTGLGLSQAALAQRSGIPQARISRAERAVASQPEAHVNEICAWLSRHGGTGWTLTEAAKKAEPVEEAPSRPLSLDHVLFEALDGAADADVLARYVPEHRVAILVAVSRVGAAVLSRTAKMTLGRGGVAFVAGLDLAGAAAQMPGGAALNIGDLDERIGVGRDRGNLGLRLVEAEVA